ncbi:ATP-dependent nuclease [Photobacterium leiognathi]|uniref:ATP-dependent nuclease n=1 Tax=Photobacterium leiognathi TaxID=553611 RepID=UPI00298271D9|nr:AAA family ATPase [Photobacterium leiognathi]
MYFSEIYIENFKTFRKVRIYLDKELNVFTGTNNAGKTTVLEALALWSECFRSLIIKAKKTDPKNNIRQGDYRLGSKNGLYIDHRSITSVRTSKYEDIFHEMNISNKILIAVKIVGADFNLEIPIRIKSANGGNYLISVDEHDKFDFLTFNSKLNLPTPFTSIYASPVAALVSDEKYVTNPQVTHQILSRRSFLVLRNRIAKLKQNNNYPKFEKDISYVLFESNSQVSFNVLGDINKDVNVAINVHLGAQSSPKDISLLGSGTLQIIELMLAIHEERSDLNLIMLDEPDSHIHRDIQKRLIEVLANNSLKAQVFLTTHNESLIRATKPNNIFHVSNLHNTKNEVQIKPIAESKPRGIKVGIQPTGKSKVIKALGNSDSLDILDCLEAKKIVFVEGEDDALYIRTIYEKVKNKSLDEYVFWSLNGLDTFIECISHYKMFFDVIANNHDLWKKVIAVIDADYMTSEQRGALAKELNSKLSLRAFIWSEYTIESSILSDVRSFSEIIFRVLCDNRVFEDKEKVYTVVSNKIHELCNNLAGKINSDSKFQEKITGQILNRSRKWSSSANIKNVFKGGEHNYFINYKSYSDNLLAENNFSHIADKNILSELIYSIFDEFNVTIDYTPLSLFEFLLTYYDNSINIPSWEQLCDFIE